MAESPSRIPLPPVLLGVGGALLTISGRSQSLSSILPYPMFYQGLLYAGLGFDVFACLWLIKVFVPWEKLHADIKGTSDAVEVQEAQEPLCLVRAGYAEEKDLSEVRQLFLKEFREAPPLDLMKALLDVNAHVFPIIKEINHESGVATIVCAAKMLPCKKRLKAMLDRDLAGGNYVRPEDVVRSGGKPGLIYVGCVTARLDYRKVWISKLVKILKQIANAQTPIYIRPTTIFGMKYTKRFPFVPVQGRQGLGHIYRINGDDAVRILNELRSIQEPPKQRPTRKRLGTSANLISVPVPA